MTKYIILILIFICKLSVLSQGSKQFEIITKVTKDSVYIKLIPINYDALYLFLTEGATVKSKSSNAVQFSSSDQIIIPSFKSIYNDKLQLSEDLDKAANLANGILSNKNGATSDKKLAFALYMIESSISKTINSYTGQVIVFPKKSGTIDYQIEIKNSAPLVVQINHKNLSSSLPKFELTGKLDVKKTPAIEWDASALNKNYLGFQIQRKTNDGLFINQTSEPYIHLITSNEKKDKLASYRDDNVEEGNTYTYRVQGIDYFGDLGSISNEIVIYVPTLVNAQIYIDTIYAQNYDRLIKFNLVKEDSLRDLGISKILIQRSDSLKIKYQTVEEIAFTGQINYSKTFVSELPTGDRHYYKIVAISKDNDSINSLPYYFFTLDQEPPKAPINLKAQIDSSGIVKITWEQTFDNDLLGFRLFRSNGKYDEYTELTKTLTTQKNYIDTLALNTLTNEAYYYVLAVDENYNMSRTSDSVLLLKPDTITPSAPILNTIVKNELSFLINWVNSESSDAGKHFLIRFDGNIADTILRWEKTAIKNYVDTNLIIGQNYGYQILVLDKSKNKAFSEIQYLYFEPGFRSALQNVVATSDRNNKSILITWAIPEEEVFQYFVYRKKGDGDFKLIKTLENKAQLDSFSDSNLNINNNYEYYIQYQTSDGFRSLKHPSLKVRY